MYKPSLINQIDGKYGDVATLDQDEMRVPVDTALIRTMSIVKKQELLSRAMYLSINTYVVTKTPWYASTWFKIVLIIIIIVITVVTWGSAGPGLAAAYAAGMGALAYYVAVQILISIAIQYAVAAFVDAVGLENSAFFAAVAIAVSAYCAYNGMPAGQEAWGEALTSASTNLVSAVEEGYQTAIVDIQKDMAAFAQTAAEQKEALQAKQDDYAADFNYVNALAYVRKEPWIGLGESPNSGGGTPTAKSITPLSSTFASMSPEALTRARRQGLGGIDQMEGATV